MTTDGEYGLYVQAMEDVNELTTYVDMTFFFQRFFSIGISYCNNIKRKSTSKYGVTINRIDKLFFFIKYYMRVI